MNPTEAKELAERIYNLMDKDLGYCIAWNMGFEPDTIKSMSDGEFIALARAYAAMPTKEETHCCECGQLLPKE